MKMLIYVHTHTHTFRYNIRSDVSLCYRQ